MIRLHQEMADLGKTIEQEMRHQLKQEQRQLDAGPSENDTASSLLDRLKERSMLGSLRSNNIRVQELATPPIKPSKPNYLLNMLLGLLLGLAGGLGLAVTQELLDNSLKEPGDLEDSSRLVLLGCVPRLNGVHRRSKEQPGLGYYRVVETDPQSPSAEAYRALRTSLIYAAPDGQSRSIVVTSPGAGEGKTTTVTNIGIALAQSGLKMLLVDADLRKGRLHEVFQMPSSPGLSDFLVGRAEFEAVVRPTSIQGLTIVARGALSPNPSELIGSARMRAFLQRAAQTFDRVMFDSPPILPVTDAAILAAMTETVVAIAQSGKTPRQALHRLEAICQEVRAKVLGVVLNSVSQQDAPAYYRYTAYQYAQEQPR